jgi:cell wall-associated NlpC family hydrolase
MSSARAACPATDRSPAVGASVSPVSLVSGRALGLGAAALVFSAVLMAVATGVISAVLSGESGGAGGAGGSAEAIGASAAASSAIPAGMLSLYETAAATCPGLPWTVLAAIGTVESGNGTSNLPGVHSGANGAGAEGPMQFEPATFAAYDEPVPPGGADPPSPYDPTDAVYAAARMLCADGASGGADISAAVLAYNHSTSYVTRVLALAQSYGQSGVSGSGSGVTSGVAAAAAGPDAGQVAVAWALAQVGTPYKWGGETPGVGFDCSGLTQAAYRVAGVTLPRVAQDQFDAGPELGSGTILEPGDLVFFGSGPEGVSHVGLYVGVRNGQAMMVDAPHAGADVRVEAFPPTLGVLWGSELVVGFTRPG